MKGVDMDTKTVAKSISTNVINGLEEVEMIQAKKFPKKTARDFLKESREK